MRIPSQATIAECEKALTELHEGKTDGVLRLPTNYKYTSVGGECSWAQFVISWAQSATAKKITTYAKNKDDAQIENLPRRLLGMIACLCSAEIRSLGDTEDLTAAFESSALERLKELQSSDPFTATRGPSLEVVAADHLGKGRPVFLYGKSNDHMRKLRSRSEFVRLAQYLLDKTVPKKLLERDDFERARAIGGLLFETFKNTEDHAMTSIHGDKLPISFRLFQASSIGQTSASLQETTKDYEPLAKYFSRFSASDPSRQLQFFVLSILDSGPGFATTWTQNELAKLTDKEEYEATVSCFASGTSKGQSRFGEGLPLVRKLLQRENGFLRLRTGRLSLYYDASDDSDPSRHRMPLAACDNPNLTTFAPVSGTLITIFIPTGAEK